MINACEADRGFRGAAMVKEHVDGWIAKNPKPENSS